MISYKEIDNKVLNVFGLKNFTTLSNVKTKNRYELGKNHVGHDRFVIAHLLATKLLKETFDNKKLWIRLVLWDEKDESVLENPIIFPLLDSLKFKKIKDNSLVLYYLLDKIDFNKIDGLIKSSVGYELGIDNTLNISCFYFDIDFSTILNIYDDRGLDIVTIK